MHIGLIIYGSLDTMSGGYLYDRLLVDYLRRQGDTVEIISLPWRSYSQHLTDNFNTSLVRRLLHVPFDVLVQDELNHPSLVLINRQLRGRAGYPIVSIIHLLRFTEPRPAWQNALYKIIEQRYLESVDGFIFNSQNSKVAVEALVGNQRPSLIAYPGGDAPGVVLDEAHICARAHESDPLRVLALGNIIPRKGLDVLLDALALLPAGSWRLTAAGSQEMDPAFVASIRQQIHGLGIAEHVHISEPLGGAALVDALASSHVLALPSWYEGFGIVYLEGMAFGLPAIASSAGAAQEIIIHGQNGFLVPPGDSAALAKYLRMLAEDRTRLTAMSLAARQRFEQFPTWEQTAASVRAYLQSIARR
jgi:glycosyltransferase involved in cell wall biosynthesis